MNKLPSPLTILMAVIFLAAGATWLIPAGRYNTLSYSNDQFIIQSDQTTSEIAFNQHSLDSIGIKIPLKKFKEGAIRKAVAIPGTYHALTAEKQGIVEIIQAPVKGIIEAADIVLFLLVMGGFMHVFNASGAMVEGLTALSYRMKGKETWLIVVLTFLFSFGGSSYGMAEEALVFYPVLTPLFLAAGYDLIVPVAVIFAGTQLGTLSSFSNPFSTIIAANAAGINWSDGLIFRIIIFCISTLVTIFYITKYALKIKANPKESIVFKVDGAIQSPYPAISANTPTTVSTRSKLLLLLFAATFLTMIGCVIFKGWWLTEMTALFLAAAITMAFLLRLKEKDFIHQFVTGAGELLSVSLIVGVARGVTIVLNEGHISDSIVYYAAQLTNNLPPALFLWLMLLLYVLFTLFISSSSGMAVLTMPIFGSLATLVHVPADSIVNAYLFGMGIMGFITPTGLILPSLALVNVSLKAWWQFLYPLLIMLTVICMAALVVGLYIQ